MDTCPRCRGSFVLRAFLVVHPPGDPAPWRPEVEWYDDLATVPPRSLVVCPECATLLSIVPPYHVRIVGEGEGLALVCGVQSWGPAGQGQGKGKGGGP